MSCPLTPGKMYDVYLSDAADTAMLSGIPLKGLIYEAELSDTRIFKLPGEVDEKGVRAERMVYLDEAFIVGAVESG